MCRVPLCALCRFNGDFLNGGTGALGTGEGDGAAHGSPTAVSGGRYYSAASAGSYHTCVLETSTRAAFCMGDNGEVRLFNVKGREHSIPRQHASSDLSGGGRRFVSQSVYCLWRGCRQLLSAEWVSDTATTCPTLLCAAYGQLGIGSTSDTNVPTAVLGGLSFYTISAGYSQSCGVLSNLTGVCWGRNVSLSQG